MEFIVTSVYLLLFLVIIRKWQFFKCEGISINTLSAIFLIKFCFGLLIWGVYTYYYTDRHTGDVFKFYDDAVQLHLIFKDKPVTLLRIIFGLYDESPELTKQLDQLSWWNTPYYYNIINDGRTMIRFNAILLFISRGYYHVHTVVICFLSLMGLMGLYKTFYPMMRDKSKELIVAIFLIPSVLFWGSGVLKEGLLLCGFGLLIYHFNFFLKSQMKSLNMVMLLFSIGILLITKVYVFLIIIPGLLTLIWLKVTDFRKAGLKFLVVYVVVISVSLIADAFNNQYSVLETLANKQRDFISVALETHAGSYIQIGELNADIGSYLTNLPQALINGLFRPYLFEAKTALTLFSGVENTLFILMILLCIFFYKKPTSAQKPWIYFSIYFIILLSLLIGLVVPVLGAIVRYKVPMLPFLAVTLLFILDKQKLQMWLSGIIKR